MPDYNHQATAYWCTVVLLGAAALLHAVLAVATLPAQVLAQVVAGMGIAMLAGCFPVRIGRSKSSFAAGEVFVILLLLLHGPAAATLAAACETGAGALRTSKRWTSRIASPAISALAMLSVGSALHAGLAALGPASTRNAGLTIGAAMLFAVLYFAANTLLVSAVPRLKRNQRLQWADWLSVFGWVGIAVSGGGAVAALVYLTYLQSGSGVLLAVVPIMAMLLATLHYHHRQQEAQEALREAATQAQAREAQVHQQVQQREADMAARHLEELRASERRFHSAFTHASIGMALLSLGGGVRQANAAMKGLLGLDEHALPSGDFAAFVHADDQAGFAAQLAQVAANPVGSFELEMRCQRGNGGQAWVLAHVCTFSEPGSAAPCLILQAQDISARRAAEASLHQLAFHDSLTGLPNRRRFGQLLEQAVTTAQADPGQAFAVLFLDFDRFKLINDSLGHEAGDLFLVQVAQRLRNTVRPGDFVARLGGDEFAVLALGVACQPAATALAERLLHALSRPYGVAGAELQSSASIGITTSANGYTSPDAVLRDADMAMYKAKAAGKARYALFDVALHTQAQHRRQLERDLRHAVESGGLSLAYQPLYDMASKRVVGFEALARWQHAELGPVGPEVFIPLAEEIGLIGPLTDFVLAQACTQLKAWQQRATVFAELTINVNISPKELGHTGLVARVTQALVQSGLEPQCLTLEITESALMERLDIAVPMLEELRRLGVHLSVDDFGTGYSSLAQLSNLPVDSLKVDRSFIRSLRPGSNHAAVVSAVVGVGRSMQKQVVAEGVETESQFDLLRDLGCETAQGYWLAPPLALGQVEKLLAGLLHPLDAPERVAA
jgi:diguanylate cyclase (GGDEF)-like protein/PAS domain S-box-containing protein